jgi:hypothetical protein
MVNDPFYFLWNNGLHLLLFKNEIWLLKAARPEQQTTRGQAPLPQMTSISAISSKEN